MAHLHSTYEHKLTKQALKLGLEQERPLFKLNENDKISHKFGAKLEVFEEDLNKKVRFLLKGFSNLQHENVSIQKRLSDIVTES